MKSIKEKRKYVMNYLTTLYDILDPSGDNTKLCKDRWSKMSDDEFGKEFDKFINNPKTVIYFEMIEFERKMDLENIFKAAEWQGLKLFEYVALPHINNDLDDVVVTTEPVPVGWIHGKRPQQTIQHKNTGSITTGRRNSKTGQVVSEDKNARNSDTETYALIASGKKYALKEFMGPRADDLYAQNQMNAAIDRDGYVSQADLVSDPHNKIALNTLDEYFIMQGLSTNLVNPLDVLK